MTGLGNLDRSSDRKTYAQRALVKVLGNLQKTSFVECLEPWSGGGLAKKGEYPFKRVIKRVISHMAQSPDEKNYVEFPCIAQPYNCMI